ncbi:calcium-binding protein [uncultured Litoreibacter sp.]|uniref:calcium-binding protein n=1 Tax=uncultured Litoreibacter sp. TaxID=1392394 RepID=UPI00260F719C|nr:calcium-binding protein [uncultured Litoreibacter sp.]
MTTITLTGTIGDDTINTSGLSISGVTQYVIVGADGNDTIITNNVSHNIFSGRGDDFILAGNGDDIINAGNGADRVFGGRGADQINGAGGGDYIDGGHGNDVIDGGSGDDFIFGRKGNNDLFGGAGNDVVNTGDHTSSADGGTGDDLIVARMKKGGDHMLTGGEGADTFEFVYQSSKKSADVTITDFELGVDDFIVGGMTDLEWADLFVSGATDITAGDNGAGGTLIDIGFNDTLTLEGVDFGDFLSYYLTEALVIV